MFDIPVIKVEVAQHEVEVKSCPCCGRLEQAEFPPDVTHHVQYGRRIRALVAYLHTVQLLLSARLVQLLEEWLDAPISEGSIYNIVQESAARLEALREPIQEKLLASPILHADETSLSVQGKRHWLHVAGTSEATWLFCHPKQGREAMEAIGLLPRYRGTIMHDAWEPYFLFTEAEHDLCNAHLLRELRALHEVHQQGWARRLSDLLLEMNRLVNEAGGALTDAQARVLEAEWDRLVQQAALWAHLRLPNGSETAAKETRRLLRRLRERKTEILRFLREPHVLFNNNLAERDLRMAKTKEKSSGTFRSEAGVEAFCLMRSVLSTIQKQKKPVAETMVELLQGNTEALFA